MALYGNILTFYDENDTVINSIETVLKNRGTKFERLNNNYFIETTSVNNTTDVVSDLKSLEVKFTFFHDHDSDGSNIWAFGIDQGKLNDIKKILLF